MKYIIVSIITIIFGFTGFLNPVRNTFQYAFAPIQFELRRIAYDIHDSFSFFASLSKVRDENIKLLEENRDLHSIIIDLKRYAEENKILREQLQLKNKDSFDKDLLLANVMGNSSDLTGATIILDKGLRHGVKIGDNIIEGNYLVGVVKEVTNERSLVNLVTSPNVSITVLNLNAPKKTEGLAVGQYGISIKMSRILPDEQANIGDIIVTSGKDGIFEPGFYVGKIIKVEQTPADPLKSAYLETIVDASSLQRVFVIL